MNDPSAPNDLIFRQLYYVNNLIDNNAPMDNLVIQFNNGYELEGFLKEKMLDLAVPESAYKTGDQYVMEPIKITLNNGQVATNDTKLKPGNKMKTFMSNGFDFLSTDFTDRKLNSILANNTETE